MPTAETTILVSGAKHWKIDPYPIRSDGVKVLRNGVIFGRPAFIVERLDGSVLTRARPRGGTMPRRFGSFGTAMEAADRHWPIQKSPT